MNMLKFIAVLLFTIATIGVAAQPGGRQREKINSQRVAYITKEMNLSVEESQRFWPVYNEMNSKLEEIKKKRKNLSIKIMLEDHQLTNDELIKSMDLLLSFEEEETALKRTYHNEYLKILSPDKLMSYYLAERKFKTFLLNRIKEERN